MMRVSAATTPTPRQARPSRPTWGLWNVSGTASLWFLLGDGFATFAKDKRVKKIERIEHVVLVCTGSDCKKKGAKDVAGAAKQCVADLGAKKRTHLLKT